MEHARTHGDFAIAGRRGGGGPGEYAAIALMGAGSTPVRATAAERALLDGADAARAAELAAELAPEGHRRALLGELVREAIERAGA